ncbi:hypothetical protein OYT1_ch2467 [Ferriphaselus amnicola]|uniref:Uncharacterized protein n=2 Tax=Ferriphaselus amnicola TaxID=1188319 RepID=A0A2Z6GEU5_9PROT|nr:hypothetical protein OYT1_ch2467 [Ferriphaselus amnicola]
MADAILTTLGRTYEVKVVRSIEQAVVECLGASLDLIIMGIKPSQQEIAKVRCSAGLTPFLLLDAPHDLMLSQLEERLDMPVTAVKLMSSVERLIQWLKDAQRDLIYAAQS